MRKVICSLALFCVTTCSSAQGDVDIFEMSLEELLQIKIATKQEQTIYSSPSSVYVINRQQIEAMGVQNLQALLNFVPGFQSTRDVEQGTANRVSARGRSTALSESVLVQIDGQKINDLYTGGISIINRLVDLGNVDHIEVIRGPGSALYGGNAFLGVINIVTRSGHNEARLTFGEPNGVSSKLAYSHQMSPGHRIDMYLSHFDDQGDEYHITDLYGISEQVQDPVNGTDLYLKYAMHDWRFTGRYMQRQLQDFLGLGSIGNDVTNEKTRQWSLSAEYQGSFSEQLNYDVSLFHTRDRWQTIALLIPENVEISPGFALSNDFIGGPFLTSQSNEAALNVSYEVNEENLFSFGASYVEAKITDVYTSTTHDLFTLEEYESAVRLTGDDSFNVKESREISSFYLQHQLHINQQWELTAGLRYDNYSDFGSSTNPRLALVYKPKAKSSVKLMYGTAFRAPNFLELYDRNNYVDFGNINLNAEEVETAEISWLTTHNNWHFEVTVFNNAYKQLIRLDEPVESPENPFFAPSFTNNDGQSSRGIESEVLYRFNHHFTARLMWNWFSKNSDINTARNSGALILDYRYDKLQINLHGFYRGQNKAVANQDSFIIASINSRYQFSPQWSLNLKLDNVFDKRYRTQTILYEQGIENRGRQMSLGVAYRF